MVWGIVMRSTRAHGKVLRVRISDVSAPDTRRASPLGYMHSGAHTRRPCDPAGVSRPRPGGDHSRRTGKWGHTRAPRGSAAMPTGRALCADFSCQHASLHSTSAHAHVFRHCPTSWGAHLLAARCLRARHETCRSLRQDGAPSPAPPRPARHRTAAASRCAACAFQQTMAAKVRQK